MRFRCVPILLAVAALLPKTSHAKTQSKLSGRLAFVQDNVVRVLDLKTCKTATVFGSRGATGAFMSPRGGALLFFVPSRAKSVDATVDQAYFARPPYLHPLRVGAPLNTISGANVQWSRDGSRALVTGYVNNSAKAFLLRPVYEVRTLPAGDESTMSPDARRYAYVRDGELREFDILSKRARVLFSWQREKPMFDALRHAANRKGVEDLLRFSDESSTRDDWRLGALAFSADGKALYFASNVGTSAGAAGNTTFAFFRCDLQSGKLQVLSKLGAQFGRMPHIAQMSPDGARFLFGTSVHSNAIDNPTIMTLMEMRTQKSRVVFAPPARGPLDSDLDNGAAWSPDNRALAISDYVYSTQQVSAALEKNPNFDPVSNDKFTLTIRDAADNRVLHFIRGAVMPSWGE